MTLQFVFQEDLKFDLMGDAVQMKGDVSQTKSGVRMEPFDGALFMSI
jgi:hypothetical protein